MRSSLIDAAFNEEEREFLYELLEQGVGEGKEALAFFKKGLSSENFTDAVQHVEMTERQERKNAFYRLFYQCLGGELTDD